MKEHSENCTTFTVDIAIEIKNTRM